MSGIGPMMLGLVMYPFMINVAQGAATSCYLACSDEVEGLSGRYFANCKEAKPHTLADDRALAERLWEVSETLTAA